MPFCRSVSPSSLSGRYPKSLDESGIVSRDESIEMLDDLLSDLGGCLARESDGKYAVEAKSGCSKYFKMMAIYSKESLYVFPVPALAVIILF